MDNLTELRNLVHQVLSTGEISESWLERARLALKEPHSEAQRCIRCGHRRYLHNVEGHSFVEGTKTGGEHTVQEEFEHFISYSGPRGDDEMVSKMWMAFYAAWSPTPTQLPEETYAKAVDAYRQKYGARDEYDNGIACCFTRFSIFRAGWNAAEEHYNRLLKNK